MIVDERRLFRQGLIALFTSEPGILVEGDAEDGLDALELLEIKKPHVLILNLNLPKLDGIGVARRVRKMSQPPEMIFLATQHNEVRMREAFKFGARAYLLQDCDFKELVFAIKKVAKEEYYLTGPAGHEMVLEYINPYVGEKDTSVMTRREKEMCRLLADGYSTKEAAARLNISVKTAETHRASIMKKLVAKNVTDIVKYCIRNKLIDP